MQSLTNIRQRVERLAASTGRCERDHLLQRLAHIIGGQVVSRTGPRQCEACGAALPETQVVHELAA